MDNSKIFDQKYDRCMSQLKEIDFSDRADILGGGYKNNSLSFDFFNRRLVVTKGGISDIDNKDVTFAIKFLLCQYVLLCPEQLPEISNKLVTFREFKNSGALFSNFTSNTNKIIETSFSGNIEKLEKQCLKLGGIIMGTNSYDICIRFKALPRIPIILNFNDRDDLMPAKASFLYHGDAEKYLDLECLSITSTYLTGQLIN
ncbi:MAG: hypothetical protein B6230_02630 [Desulfobacteraceae bacterium 4572_89]|nr:MAG: hypothetical protein B6230_02630 [Desulfobacteraceae bacterium 4572_89]